MTENVGAVERAARCADALAGRLREFEASRLPTKIREIARARRALGRRLAAVEWSDYVPDSGRAPSRTSSTRRGNRAISDTSTGSHPSGAQASVSASIPEHTDR